MNARASRSALTPAFSIEGVYHRYVETFAGMVPEEIVLHHAESGIFWLRSGSAPVYGRPMIAQAFARLFATWPGFGFRLGRVVFAPTRWILEWAVTAELTDAAGEPWPVRIDALDIVDVDEEGLVLRKETWLEGEQARAVLAVATGSWATDPEGSRTGQANKSSRQPKGGRLVGPLSGSGTSGELR